MTIQENAAAVLAQVEQACQSVGRSAQSVHLVAVTKSVDSSIAKELVETTPICHVAENRVDQFLEKYEALKEQELTWHLIGTLQRRKVKSVIDFVDYFHALDSVSLAQEIQKRARKPVKCFLQVNVSGEKSKHGFAPDQLEEALEAMAELDKVELVGVMTMAPFEATSSELSALFKETKHLQEQLAAKALPHMPFTELSMGMSSDFPEAIQEGATFVRVGTAFFK